MQARVRLNHFFALVPVKLRRSRIEKPESKREREERKPRVPPHMKIELSPPPGLEDVYPWRPPKWNRTEEAIEREVKDE